MSKIGLNQILITKKTGNALFVLGADLYEIESQVTNETKIQSVATTTRNEHTVEMFPNQCVVLTKVPSANLELQPVISPNLQIELHARFLAIELKACKIVVPL